MDSAMNTGFMIKFTIAFMWVTIALAGFNVARFYDLVVQGWPALAALLGIMIGGKTMERVKELKVGASTTTVTATSTIAKDDDKS